MGTGSLPEISIELELETRRTIFEFIRQNPGSHLREIQRRLGLPIGVLNFHIQNLSMN